MPPQPKNAIIAAPVSTTRKYGSKQVVQVKHPLADSPALTAEQIEWAFENLNIGGSDRTILRPINFSLFRRTVTGEQNLFKEMETFHK